MSLSEASVWPSGYTRLALWTSDHEALSSNTIVSGISLMTVVPHCTESFITTLPSSQYDLIMLKVMLKTNIISNIYI